MVFVEIKGKQHMPVCSNLIQTLNASVLANQQDPDGRRMKDWEINSIILRKLIAECLNSSNIFVVFEFCLK